MLERHAIYIDSPLNLIDSAAPPPDFPLSAFHELKLGSSPTYYSAGHHLHVIMRTGDKFSAIGLGALLDCQVDQGDMQTVLYVDGIIAEQLSTNAFESLREETPDVTFAPLSHIVRQAPKRQP